MLVQIIPRRTPGAQEGLRPQELHLPDEIDQRLRVERKEEPNLPARQGEASLEQPATILHALVGDPSAISNVLPLPSREDVLFLSIAEEPDAILGHAIYRTLQGG